jgi:GNAT superfamily N-acetyltransferase
MITDTQFSLARNRVSLGIRCRWGMQHALFYVAKDSAGSNPDRVIGTAMWMSPSNPFAAQSWSDYFGSWTLWLQQVYMNTVYGRGGLNVKRYWIWKAAQADAQKELWRDEKGYYFCNIVTVMPDAQGKGIGRELFNVVMKQADAEGRRCYLESSRAEPNMKIYEKMGFELRREMDCDDDGTSIRLFCMIREPRGQ